MVVPFARLPSAPSTSGEREAQVLAKMDTVRMRKEKDGSVERGLEDGIVHHSHGDIRGDEKKIVILFFLYLLQGIPLGLSNTIPMILQNRGASYRQQAEFSLVQWPFSLKLLWAPIVDSIFSRKFGRRKTWLIPTQYLVGMFMLLLSGSVEHWLGDEHRAPNVGILTVMFFILNVLAATQDIVVDGWALTMLQRRNVGYASTCNTVGQTTGFFLGYILFMALESATFCNTYLRSVPSDDGIITLSGFLYFWGCVFLVTTTLIAVLKHEDPEKHEKSEVFKTKIMKAYHTLWLMMKLRSIRILTLILLTMKIGFSACDAVTGLKMIDSGIPKEKFVLMTVPMIPLQIILPVVISKYTAGPRPMDVSLKAMPYRLMFCLLAAFLVWITPQIVHDGIVPGYYFVAIMCMYFVHQITVNCMYVASMAFFAKISDPAIGGTYMTLLNTLNNIGGNWPSTVALWLVDVLSIRQCSTDASNDCSSIAEREMCTNESKGECNMTLDGYYVESVLCVLIGFIWLRWGRRKISYLQDQPSSVWQVACHD